MAHLIACLGQASLDSSVEVYHDLWRSLCGLGDLPLRHPGNQKWGAKCCSNCSQSGTSKGSASMKAKRLGRSEEVRRNYCDFVKVTDMGNPHL